MPEESSSVPPRTWKETCPYVSGGFKRCVQGSTSWLNRLVNRRVVTIFAVMEVVVGGVLGIFYLFFGRISGVSPWVPTAVFSVLICALRSTSGTIGVAAAWFRLVTRTRVYWGLVLANFILSYFPGVALYYTTCRCEYDVGGWEVDEGQCIALRSFDWLKIAVTGSPARRLSSSVGIQEEMAWLRSAGEGVDIGVFEEPDLSQLLESFVVLDAGLRLNSTLSEGAQLNATELDNKTEEPAEYGALLRGLQCSGFEGVVGSPDVVRSQLVDGLMGCADPDCGGVELRLSMQASGALMYSASRFNQTVFPTMTKADVETAIACRLVEWDCSSTSPPGEYCEEHAVFLLRKVQEPDGFQTWSSLWPYCEWTTRITFGLLVFFSALVPFVLIIIFKYFSGHCQDNFELEAHQFDVDDASPGADEDDWNVGTWISIPNEHKRARQSRDGSNPETFPAGSFTSFAFRSTQSSFSQTQRSFGDSSLEGRHRSRAQGQAVQPAMDTIVSGPVSPAASLDGSYRPGLR